MRQKEVQNPSAHLLQSFKQSAQINNFLHTTDNFRKKNTQKDEKDNKQRKRAISSKFNSGKEYVEMARQELMNKPLFPNKYDVTLQNRPNIPRLQSTKVMIQNQIISRRERHFKSLTSYQNTLETCYQKEKENYKLIKKNIRSKLKKNDEDAAIYFAQFTDLYLQDREIDLLSELAEFITQNEKERNKCLDGLSNLLDRAKEDYFSTFQKQIKTLQKDLMDISFLLEPEVMKVIQEFRSSFEKEREEIEKRNQGFKIDIDKFLQETTEKDKKQQNDIEQKWRIVKHNQTENKFKEDIQLKMFVFPDQRENLYKVIKSIQELKEIHLNIFQNRYSLFCQLRDINCSQLSMVVIEGFNKVSNELNDHSQKSYDLITDKLLKQIEGSKNKLNVLLEDFTKKLHFYNAEKEQPIQEIIDEKFKPMVEKIQNDDKQLLQDVIFQYQVLNYLEESDFQSSEIINNISTFFNEISKKQDTFRIKQKESILKYEVEKAKLADTNEEDLDKLYDQLEELKTQLKQSMHHPILEECLQKNFQKIDDIQTKIREQHELNLELQKSHIPSINQLFKEFAMECAEYFNLKTNEHRHLLEEKYQQELDEQIKQVIEQEKLAADEAIKATGKAPPKVDAKKAKLEQEARILELQKEMKPRKVPEVQLHNQVWIQIIENSEIYQKILSVADSKECIMPYHHNNPMFEVPIQFQLGTIFDETHMENLILTFRENLFNMLLQAEDNMIKTAKAEDHSFIDNSIILLDERLKQLYPLKGQIEVELYQKRSGQITEHKQKYERHSRTIIQKNEEQSEQFNFFLKESIIVIRQYYEEQNKIKETLPLQPQLSKLQGQLNASKGKQYSFQEKQRDICTQLEDLANQQSQQLLKSNVNFMNSLRENPEYYEEELKWYSDMIEEITLQVQQYYEDKQQKYEEHLEKNNLEAFKEVEEQYKISSEELAQKYGNGKLYGRPKRMAQEKLRLEMTKCEQAQKCIDDILEEIQETNNHMQLRYLMNQLRVCVHVYGNHINAFLETSPEMQRFSKNTLKFRSFISTDEAAKDQEQQEIELERIGSLAFQSDRTKNFEILVQSIDKAVKEDCQKIYQGTAAKWLTGNDKLPDWIRPYMDNILQSTKEFRLNSCRNLREQCMKFYEMSKSVNQKIYKSLFEKHDFIVQQQNNQFFDRFNKFLYDHNEYKRINSFNLRPNLSNPACKQELDNLIEKEADRVMVFETINYEFQMEFYKNELTQSNICFIEFLNFFEFLVTYYDKWLLFEDFRKLPGDDQMDKRKKNLKTLYKLKQDGSSIDYNSLRGIKKEWPCCDLQMFQVEGLHFDFAPYNSSGLEKSEDLKSKKSAKQPPKDKDAPQEVDPNKTQVISSFKNESHKTSYQAFSKYLDSFHTRFEQSISQGKLIFREQQIQEKKFITQWQKSCQDLFTLQ